jgi:hypothetical protein
MVVVAGLAVLGMTATLAGAQTVEVKKKPPLYRYVSYWTIPRAHWKAGSWKGAYGYKATYKLRPDAPDPDDAIRTLSSFYVPVFEKMLADGIIVEYEISREMIHTADSRAQVVYSFVMPSAEGLDKFRAASGRLAGIRPQFTKEKKCCGHCS